MFSNRYVDSRRNAIINGIIITIWDTDQAQHHLEQQVEEVQ
jgi:hypothetical protein